MKFDDIGIIISYKKYSENSLIVKILSRNHGVYRGFVKGGLSKKNRAIFQIGNVISFEWKSRIEDSLGSFYYYDLVKSFISEIIFDKLKLNCVNSIFSIIDSCFLERENHEILFEKIYDFLKKLSNSDKNLLLANYIKLELKILKILGYGVDLSSCVVTNSVEDLIFVSPKSARAVSRDAAKSYEHKLLKLPQFLLQENHEIQDDNHIFDGLKLSGYFLEKFVLSHNNVCLYNRKDIEDEVTASLSVINS
ncbi:MAG TPA: DNA repair protein RecO [Rickettsiales bacterium]|nr:DNA repair protein RecO [Rickettsiales bacterium]